LVTVFPRGPVKRRAIRRALGHLQVTAILPTLANMRDASTARGQCEAPIRRSVSIVLGEEILIQTFELDCSAGADPDPMLNHEVCQVLAIE
jgi:hypothetical protein